MRKDLNIERKDLNIRRKDLNIGLGGKVIPKEKGFKF